MNKQISPELARRLLYILHRGLCEARNMAIGAGHEQLTELTDALEILPCFINHWEDENMEMIQFVLQRYKEKYPGNPYDYIANLESNQPLERF